MALASQKDAQAQAFPLAPVESSATATGKKSKMGQSMEEALVSWQDGTSLLHEEAPDNSSNWHHSHWHHQRSAW